MCHVLPRCARQAIRGRSHDPPNIMLYKYFLRSNAHTSTTMVRYMVINEKGDQTQIAKLFPTHTNTRFKAGKRTSNTTRFQSVVPCWHNVGTHSITDTKAARSKRNNALAPNWLKGKPHCINHKWTTESTYCTCYNLKTTSMITHTITMRVTRQTQSISPHCNSKRACG